MLRDWLATHWERTSWWVACVGMYVYIYHSTTPSCPFPHQRAFQQDEATTISPLLPAFQDTYCSFWRLSLFRVAPDGLLKTCACKKDWHVGERGEVCFSALDLVCALRLYGNLLFHHMLFSRCRTWALYRQNLCCFFMSPQGITWFLMYTRFISVYCSLNNDYHTLSIWNIDYVKNILLWNKVHNWS